MKPINEDKIITVSKQIGESTAVWFAASRSFVLFEKPAWDVFVHYSNNQTISDITDHIAYNYKITLADSQKFVDDIIDRINQINDPSNLVYRSLELFAEFDGCTFPVFIEKSYLIGNKCVRFIYGSEWLMNCFHPSMAHLETKFISDDQLFEVFELNDLLIFRYNGKVIDAFSSENSHYLRGTVTQKLFGVLYNVDDSDWMITLHSAAISDGNSAIIFPAQAGSGKSTLSALLQAHGFTVLSDDFNVINRGNGFAYRLPLAISVKEGSLKVLKDYYPELKKIIPEKAITGKLVWNLPVENNLPGSPASFHVKAFVFVNYSDSDPFVFEEVNKLEAIQLLLSETWVSPHPENVAQFFNWLDTVGFYRLHYTNYQDAVNAISFLFKD